MSSSPAERAQVLQHLAATCVQRIAAAPGESFAAAAGSLTPDLRMLLDELARQHAQFAFDAEGRPGAIDAVRHALPAVERELFEAVVEDHACELAAVREAMYHVVLAALRRG